MTVDAYTDQDIQRLVDEHFASILPTPSAYDIAQRLNGDLEEWVYPGFVCDSYTMFVGKPKQGKSLLAVNLAASFISGEPFIGVSPAKALSCNNVLIVTTEANGEKENVRRLQALGVDLQHAFVNRVGIEGVPELSYEAAEAGNVGLVIIDNILGVCRGIDINKPEAITALTEVAERFNRAGVPVVFIHHSAKASGSDPLAASMGNNGIVGLMRHVVGVVKSKDAVKLTTEGNVGDSGSLRIRFDKNGKAERVEDAKPEASEANKALAAMAELARSAPASCTSKADVFRYVTSQLDRQGVYNANGTPYSENTVKNRINQMVKSDDSSLRWDAESKRFT